MFENPLVVAILIVTLGALLTGIGIGRRSIIRCLERNNTTLAADPWTNTLAVIGMSILLLGYTYGILVLTYPAEKLRQRADQIRLAVGAETNR